MGTVGGGALEKHAQEHAGDIFASGENDVEELDLAEIGMQCGGNTMLTYELISARDRFILFGGGHVGRALLPILESLGFLVTVYDDRKGIIDGIADGQNRACIHGAYEDLSRITDLIEHADYLFIATQGHTHDYDVLRQLLRTDKNYRYIGLIGSRRKVSALLDMLEKDGLDVPSFLYAPVGLHIGGDTAEEIAVSVASEVVAVKNGVDAPHLRLTERRNT
jgi:xanthine dehydrogenase accessory factor